VLGAGFTLAFAPYDMWYLVFLLLPATVYLFAKIASNNEKLFWPAWCFGLGYFGLGISWVHVSIAEFGGVPLVASLGLMLLLSAYLALFPALTFTLLQRLFKPQLWPLAIPLLWLCAEWIRAHFLTGFPWLSIAYSQTNSILSSWMPVIGEIGLSAIIVLVSTSLAIGILQKRLVLALLPISVMFAAAFTLHSINWTTPNGETRNVALVQGNIEQSMRWRPELDQLTIEKYIALSEPYWGADIIVWPEAAIPRLEMLAKKDLSWLDKTAKENHSGFITGIVDYNLETSIAYNSLLALGFSDANNNAPYAYQHRNRFSKHHLLPIGEFVPFEDLLRPLAPIFNLPMSSFSRGEYVQENLHAGNTYLVPAICFEIAFPKQISANLNTSSNMIITVSNDAWFGDSHGPHQHLQIAQARALEFGLPVLRATNTGVTAFIDHKGQINQQLPQFTDAVLNRDVQLVNGTTPYRRYKDWPIWLFSGVLIVFAIYLRKQSI